MAKVRVFNLNVHPLHERFKGEEVLIASQDYWRDPKGKIRELDIYEANDFRGQYHPVPFDGSGKMVNDPKHFKMLRMEPVEDGVAEDEEDTPAYKCMAKECKHVSPSAEELEAHIRVRHAEVDRLVLPEVDKEMKRRGRPAKKEIEEEKSA